MAKIQTRIFNYGDEKEADWPPPYGSQEKGLFYFDKETQKMVRGLPPDPHPKLAEAPYIIQDTIDKYYHPAAEKWVDSRSQLKTIDKVCGTITTDKKLEPDSSWARENKRKRREDLHRSMRKAIAQLDAGTAPLTQEVREKCERQNEIVSEALGLDAFNVAGRKNNAKGKRFRKRRR